MKKIYCFVLVFSQFLIGFSQKNGENSSSLKRYHSKFDLAEAILNGAMKRDASKLKSIASSLVISYADYMKVVFPLYKSDSSVTLEDFPKNEVYPTSSLIQDPNKYKKHIADFYCSEYISKLISDADNASKFGTNIYIAFDKVDDSISPVINKNYLGILYETKDYIKVINAEALITYKNTLYSMRQINFHSYNKKNLPDYLLEKFPNTMVVYKYVNQKFVPYSNDTILFKNADYSRYTNEPYFVDEVTVQNTEPENGDNTATEIKEEEQEPKEPEIFDRAEVMPEFPGGVAEMMKFIQQNLDYPKSAIEKGLEGLVIVKFIIDNNGRVVNPIVLKDAVGGGCAEEAIRLVKSMPKWNPGTQREKPVKVYYTLPIRFKLK